MLYGEITAVFFSVIPNAYIYIYIYIYTMFGQNIEFSNVSPVVRKVTASLSALSREWRSSRTRYRPSVSGPVTEVHIRNSTVH
jgi:hypothetical protein